MLAQGGEFAFVLLQLAEQLNVLPRDLSQILIIVVALSMALTPGLAAAGAAAAGAIEARWREGEAGVISGGGGEGGSVGGAHGAAGLVRACRGSLLPLLVAAELRRIKRPAAARAAPNMIVQSRAPSRPARLAALPACAPTARTPSQHPTPRPDPTAPAPTTVPRRSPSWPTTP